MITIFIIYLIGVLISYFLIALNNDFLEGKEEEKANLNLVVYSWLFVIVFTIYLILEILSKSYKYLSNLEIWYYKPSLKPFKNLFKKKN